MASVDPVLKKELERYLETLPEVKKSRVFLARLNTIRKMMSLRGTVLFIPRDGRFTLIPSKLQEWIASTAQFRGRMVRYYSLCRRIMNALPGEDLGPLYLNLMDRVNTILADSVASYLLEINPSQPQQGSLGSEPKHPSPPSTSRPPPKPGSQKPAPSIPVQNPKNRSRKPHSPKP